MVLSAGYDPATPALKVRCSDRLSYDSRLKLVDPAGYDPATFRL